MVSLLAQCPLFDEFTIDQPQASIVDYCECLDVNPELQKVAKLSSR
jgi:hypothetical protein